MSQSLWYSGLRPAPLPPAQPLSLSTTGLNILCVQNSNLFLKWGGAVSKWVLWGRTVLGVMPPVHVQGPVCPDHVAASAWLPVSWLCRFGCPPVQWCPVGRSPPCVGSIPERVDDYPKYTWDGLTLNLFCSITFISKGYT